MPQKAEWYLWFAYWQTVWRERPPAKLYSPYRAIPSVVIAVLQLLHSWGNRPIKEIWIAPGIIVGVYIGIYILEVGFNVVVRSPALLDQRKTNKIGELEGRILPPEESQRKPAISQKAIEILAATADGLPDFGEISISSNRDYLWAGRICFRSSEPVELAEYLEAVDALLTGGWVIRPDWTNPSFYEPTAKGWTKAKEVLDSPEGKRMIAELHARFPAS